MRLFKKNTAADVESLGDEALSDVNGGARVNLRAVVNSTAFQVTLRTVDLTRVGRIEGVIHA